MCYNPAILVSQRYDRMKQAHKRFLSALIGCVLDAPIQTLVQARVHLR
jgi:hypothetical protein